MKLSADWESKILLTTHLREVLPSQIEIHQEYEFTSHNALDALLKSKPADDLAFQIFKKQLDAGPRAWRFDVAIPEFKTGFEISGGQFTGGHRRGFFGKKRKRPSEVANTPQEDEYDKLNTAQFLGWRVFQFSPQQVSDGRALTWLKQHFIWRIGEGICSSD